MKQKKLYEGQISQLQQQTFNMEQASLTTENLRNTMATVDAMKTANKEMRKQYGKIDIDKIEVRSWLSIGRVPFIIISLSLEFCAPLSGFFASPLPLPSWLFCHRASPFSARDSSMHTLLLFPLSPAYRLPLYEHSLACDLCTRSPPTRLPQIPLIPVLCGRFLLTDPTPLSRSKCNTTWRT